MKASRRSSILVGLGITALLACGPGPSGESRTQDAGAGHACASMKAPYGGRCFYDSDCMDPMDVCVVYLFNSPAGKCGSHNDTPGVCKRPCANDGECAGVGAGWCNPAPYKSLTFAGGVCAVSCDPIGNAPCPGTCQLFPDHDHTRADCVSAIGSACPAGQLALQGGTGATCEHLCRLDHPADCAGAVAGLSSVCLPVDSGSLDDVSTGTSYGTCRAQCSQSAPCPTDTICIDDTQPGKPPVTDCVSNCDASGCCGPSPAWVDYPNVNTFSCTAPSWGTCTNSCASSSDCPMGEACEPTSALPAGSCPGPRCLPTCMIPPIPCSPFDPGLGLRCPSGQACVLTGNAAAGQETACVPAGTAAYPAACATSNPSACAPGFGCVSYGDPEHGLCEGFCMSSGLSVCPGTQVCTSTIDIPQSPAGIELGRCTTACDLANPSMTCPKAMTCVEFEDVNGTPTTDCIPPTGSGTGAGGCTSGPLACAPGYSCRASDGACVPWCYVGQPASCTTGSCVAATPALVVARIAYGTCE